ncbi:MAG: hypothetical protein JWO90_918 [Solirubrobacterales bacterium]|nr:hypothetical protein [Solirubrobacterales bacterium]
MRPAALTVALGVLLLLVAATFDAEPMYVPGAGFALLGAMAIAWVTLGSLGLEVERTVAVKTVVENHPVDVAIRVRAGLTPLLTGTVEEDLLDAPAPLALGQREMALRIHARFAHRGRRVLPPVRVVVRDPFGLAGRTLVAGGEAELLVLPAVHPVATLGGGGEGGVLSPKAGRPRMAAEVELDGVRPHRPGAPASRIQWSVFARTGELWERKLLADADSRPLLVLDPRTAGAEDPRAALDAAVRALASLAVALAKEGGCSVQLPGDKRPTVIEPGLGAWPRVHVRLALIADDGSAPSLAGVSSRSGPVVYVAARPIARPPRALRGGSVRVLVTPSTPGTPPGRRALFSVAGCTGHQLRESRHEAVA